MKDQKIDFWEMNIGSRIAVLGEFKKTTSGHLISLALFSWTETKLDWIDSFRIHPLVTLSISDSEKALESQLVARAKELTKTISMLPRVETQNLPLEELNRFKLKTRIFAWLQIREHLKTKYTKDFEALGINKTTTLDYLNLQAIGLKDYQRIISQLDNSKPLTVRDRIAYARRHKWIQSVGHGDRTGEMTRLET
jgi:hypothetical protein